MIAPLKKLFGSSNDRFVKTLRRDVEAINALEADYEALKDAELAQKSEAFRERLKAGESLDDILHEAFAVVREAAKRVLGQRHYDVQLMGGIVLHRGMITEMKTGEGKTLVSTLPVYLNALEGKGVHVVTVNDYLASRDAEWMGEIYRFLGLSVGVILNNMMDEERREAYAKDITYGTNNEYGFDYLRDNMKFRKEDMVQRPYNFAVVDEVDSILIDEARTPLIISGPVEDNTDTYITLNKYIPELSGDDYEIDEKQKAASFTEEGTQHLEDMLKRDGLLPEDGNLYDIENVSLVHHANQALRAHKLFERDKDYIVKEDRVVIIDEFTGRMMEGRRYSEGLHQALEAREGVAIQNENQTLASITFQNYFRMYPKLAGMTGTAMTEADEFEDIYGLKVVEMPTHKPIARVDEDDEIYRTAEEKFDAIIELIKECVEKKQPVLVGTASIERSEYLAAKLKKAKIKHNVLNARYHEQEAYIIAQAGRPGAVTVATNMAGRGTDIQLGGNADMLIDEKSKNVEEEKRLKEIAEKIKKEVERDREIVREAGGLYVVGTERHESRRIDNQLRGRSGRQGDPGRSIFFLSAEDDLIRIFGADKKMDWVLGTMGSPGEPIAHPLLTRMMEKSQQKVEARNYEIRKTLLKFDDVMNDQRKVVFEQRIELMEAKDGFTIIKEMTDDVIDDMLPVYMPERAYAEQWDMEGFEKEVHRVFNVELPLTEWAKEEGIAEQEIKERLQKAVFDQLDHQASKVGADDINQISQKLLLFTLDEMWKDHLLSLDHLRQGINLRAYGQKDPLNEYKREAFDMFEAMLNRLREMAVLRMCRLEFTTAQQSLQHLEQQKQERMARQQRSHYDPTVSLSDRQQTVPKTVVNHVKPEDRDPTNPDTWGKVGRNEPCPCGSGKKYKQCHGALA